jgi:protease
MLMAFLAVSLGVFAQANLRDGFEEYTLKNGMKVYLWVDKDIPNVYGQVAVRAGSIDEPADFTGLAHYLEHMLFKGTQEIGALDWAKEKPMYEQIIKLYDEKAKLRDPKKDKAKRDELTKKINELSVASSKISKGSEFPTLIQAAGGTGLNAYTNFDQTVYHNSFPAYQMENWLKLYYDHFQRPVFREFQAEMENVFEELNLRTPSIGYQQYITLFEKLFKGSYYARGVIGTPEHLKNPSMTPMIKFFEDWYVPNNMGLLLYGNFDPEQAKPLIEKTFGKMQSKKLPERKPTVPTPLTKNEKIKVKLGYSPSIVWGYNGVKKGHPDEFKIDFMLSILNNSYNTGLFDKLNMEGAIGGVNASSMAMRDCGRIIIQASPYFDVSQYTYESDAATEKLVMAEINKLKRGQIPTWLMQSVKESYLQSLKTISENPETKIDFATESYLYGIPMSEYFNMEEKVKAITVEDIKAIANKYFSGNYMTISFSEGDPKIQLFDKAQIDPLQMPDEEYSQYYKDFVKRPVQAPTPKFTDFSDIQSKDLFKGGKMFYVKNPKNDIFSLTLEYQVGTHTDKKLQYAASLMNYAGTMPNQSNNDLRRELSKHGASYGVGVSDNKFVINVVGNEKDLDKIMPIIFRLCLMPKLDNKQIEAVMGSAVQSRMFEKRIPWYITAALMEYIQYGDQSRFIDRIPSKKLIFVGESGYNFLITNSDLTATIQKVTSYPVNIHYVGAKPMEEVAEILKGTVPTQKTILEPQKEFYRDRVSYNEPEIYFLPNTDIQQAEVTMYFPIGNYDNSQYVDYTAFSRYFGAGGLNNICFSEIREKRSLAYSTYGAVSMNPMNKTSWFIGSTGTQNDKVNTVVDIYMDLLKNMPMFKSYGDNIKTTVMTELAEDYVTFRGKSSYYENTVKKMGFTEDPNKTWYKQAENLTFDNIAKFYNEKIKNAPVIIVIHGNPKYIDIKSIEKKYGKVNRVPISKIFQGGEM